MTAKDKNRMIELLIKEVDATGKKHDWFSSKEDAFELQKLLVAFDPDNESRRESLKRFLLRNPSLS